MPDKNDSFVTKHNKTTSGFYGLPWHYGLIYRISIVFFKSLSFFFWRVQIRGLEKLPKQEPYLLLANHSSVFDPFWVGIYVPRGLKAMASSALLRVPYVGAYLKIIGCFPKMKYTKDRESMEALQKFYDQGYPVMLFPEGNRSWDGRIGPVGKGIGRLIKRMNCKVVYVRLHSASLFQPRWAKYPRWVPIEIEYDGPYEYGEDRSVDDIWQAVIQNISVEPRLPKKGRCVGFRMAHGLSEYLWACPSCFSLGALDVSPSNGNAIYCTACDTEWTLNVQNQLHNAHEETTVREAFEKITEHFGSRPVAVPEQFQKEQVVLSCDGAVLTLNKEKQKMELIAEGMLQITEKGIVLKQADDVVWMAVFSRIEAISVEIANMLQFRVDGILHRIKTKGQSPLMWAHFLRTWKEAALND